MKLRNSLFNEAGNIVGMYPNREHSWKWITKEYDTPTLQRTVSATYKVIEEEIQSFRKKHCPCIVQYQKIHSY